MSLKPPAPVLPGSIPDGRMGVVAWPTAKRRPFALVAIHKDRAVLEFDYAEVRRALQHYESLIARETVLARAGA